MTMQDLLEEFQEAGYKVTIEYYGVFSVHFEIICFEKHISIDRVKMSMSTRGWKIVETKQFKEKGKDLQRWFLLRRSEPFTPKTKIIDEVELQDCLIGVENTTAFLRGKTN